VSHGKARGSSHLYFAFKFQVLILFAVCSQSFVRSGIINFTDAPNSIASNHIEDSISAKKRPELCLSTAAYDTAWHHGLTCQLLKLLPDRHMAHMIMEMVSNRSCTLTTENSNRSRIRRLKNSVPQGSVRASLILNTYCTSLTCQPPSPESMHMLTA